MKCRNYKGEMIEAPADLYQHVATHADNHIVWSRRGRLHQVRYGLQVSQFHDSFMAAREFGHCVHHYAECEGLLS